MAGIHRPPAGRDDGDNFQFKVLSSKFQVSSCAKESSENIKDR
jgi:hypothetical protein